MCHAHRTHPLGGGGVLALHDEVRGLVFEDFVDLEHTGRLLGTPGQHQSEVC